MTLLSLQGLQAGYGAIRALHCQCPFVGVENLWPIDAHHQGIPLLAQTRDRARESHGERAVEQAEIVQTKRNLIGELAETLTGSIGFEANAIS